MPPVQKETWFGGTSRSGEQNPRELRIGIGICESRDQPRGQFFEVEVKTKQAPRYRPRNFAGPRLARVCHWVTSASVMSRGNEESSNGMV